MDVQKVYPSISCGRQGRLQGPTAKLAVLVSPTKLLICPRIVTCKGPCKYFIIKKI